MLTFTSFTSCSSAIRSRIGATAGHGPHHSAQKSTSTLPSDSRTSCSKLDVVAVVAIHSFRELHGLQRPRPSRSSRLRTIESMFTPPGHKPDHSARELEIPDLWERD